MILAGATDLAWVMTGEEGELECCEDKDEDGDQSRCGSH